MTVLPIILIRAASIRPGRSGPATGDIWIEVNSHAFPAARWNDFVYVITARLLEATRSVCEGRNRVECVHFMEGPYALHLESLSQDLLELRLLERPTKVMERITVSKLYLVRHVIETGRRLLEAWPDAVRYSGDVRGMESELALLMRASVS